MKGVPIPKETEMEAYQINIFPQTAFGTEIKGDTLFGQFCWVFRLKYGNRLLEKFLENYREKPRLVFSDAFPEGCIPKPSVPLSLLEVEGGTSDRKNLKRLKWLSREKIEKLTHVGQWFSPENFEEDIEFPAPSEQWRNSINRLTSTTGGGDVFAPFVERRFWYGNGSKPAGGNRVSSAEKFLRPPVVYALLETGGGVEREGIPSEEEFKDCLDFIGKNGYGGGASYGLGKFECCLERTKLFENSRKEGPQAFMTLANCRPIGFGGILPKQSFYETVTVIGRHGQQDVFRMSPFKRPLLMCKAGAVFTLENRPDKPYVGKHPGQEINLSSPRTNGTEAGVATVHQCCAPAIPVELPATMTMP